MGGSNNKHAVNQAVAFVMPVVMIGVIGFATYVFCALICVNYLMIEQRRREIGITLLTIYILLALPLLSAYFRVAYTIHINPGFILRGPFDNKPKPELEGTAGGVGGEKERSHRASYGGPLSRPGNWIPLQSSSDSAVKTIPYRSRTPPPPLQPLATHLPVSSQLSQGETGNSNLSEPSQPTSAADGDEERIVIQMPIPHEDQRDFGSSRPNSFSQAHVPKNLKDFYCLDAFICESDGLPKWCYHCNCWKPDRSHHCSEVGRCVMKMDHFCPWVGGVIGETSFKYFYQVVVYAAIYCGFLLISTAVMLHNQGTEHGRVPSTWVATLALAAIFGLFSAGMAGSTTQLILRNTSTIDNLSARTKVYQIAIYDPTEPAVAQIEPEFSASRRKSITEGGVTGGMGGELSPCRSPTHHHQSPVDQPEPVYNPNTQINIHQEGNAHITAPSLPPPPTPSLGAPASTFTTSHKRVIFPYDDPAFIEPPPNSPNPAQGVVRTFVIAKTQPGENPWKLPTAWENFAEIMGYNLWNWWLPIRPSPCVKHEHLEGGNNDVEGGSGGTEKARTTGWYRWNEELLDRLRAECGITTTNTATTTQSGISINLTQTQAQTNDTRRLAGHQWEAPYSKSRSKSRSKSILRPNNVDVGLAPGAHGPNSSSGDRKKDRGKQGPRKGTAAPPSSMVSLEES